MISYPIPMIPGPVSVPGSVLDQYLVNFGSPDLEPEFLSLYNRLEANLQRILATQNRVAIQSGEGMLALWSGLKSCLAPGDRVLALATGVFGYGIGEMAGTLGAEVRTYGIGYDQTLSDWDAIEVEIASFKPKMITVVHCETPSGTLNPLEELGRLKRQYEVPLLYADIVASLGGAPVEVDAWGIDLGLGGSQKCLSAPPGVCFVSVSERAWEIAEQVGYTGYDALLPFRKAQESFYFPYTPYWHGLAALNTAAELVLAEGLENVFNRHEKAAAACRQGLAEAGYRLFPAPEAIPAPTVTAAYVPENIPWPEFDARLRGSGLAVGGSYGPLSGKVFRVGHMGAQADISLLDQALLVLRSAL
jgi:aspartate aminotransferase-like enzyme